MSIKVDSSIKLPDPLKHRRGRSSIYPWKAMKVGQSFLFPRDRKNAPSAAHAASRAYKRKFVTRVTPQGIRCWRVK